MLFPDLSSSDSQACVVRMKLNEHAGFVGPCACMGSEVVGMIPTDH